MYIVQEELSSEDGVTRGVSSAVCSNRSRWCFIGETEEKKKRVNDYLLKRTTKGSYGGLLTEMSLEKEIFKEYLRRIQSISASSEILCIQYFCIHQIYCILQRYRVSQPAVVIQSISVWHNDCPHSILAHSIAATPNDLPPWLLVLHWGDRAARGDNQSYSEHARYVHFSALLPLHATLSELVACCNPHCV